MIDKANTTIVIAVAVAAATLAFSLVTARSLLIKRSYQSKVISVQEKARDQLEENIDNIDVLAASYSEFVNRPENIIGGDSEGEGDQDGDNAKIIIDALPGRYDFPALISSIEKILIDRNYLIQSLGGNDQPPGEGDVASSGDVDASVADGDTGESGTDSEDEEFVEVTPIEMPFEMTALGPYTSMVDLLKVFERSVRPIVVNQITFTAGDGSAGNQVEMTVEGQSFFQPEKTLDIKYEVVK